MVSNFHAGKPGVALAPLGTKGAQGNFDTGSLKVT